jgi:2-keto-4-pentenoate hydratase/2-oxohepta-3-ene-1,7-dioic acid hydratase in catechol pathway
MLWLCAKQKSSVLCAISSGRQLHRLIPSSQKVAVLPAMAAAAQRLLSASTKIVGVGRNYVAHAKELGNPVPKVRLTPHSDPPPLSDPEAPFFFLRGLTLTRRGVRASVRCRSRCCS